MRDMFYHITKRIIARHVFVHLITVPTIIPQLSKNLMVMALLIGTEHS